MGEQLTLAEKECTTCHATLPLDSFYSNASKPDGRTAQCKECHRESTNAYRDRNPERKAAWERHWHERHPGWRAKKSDRYRKENPEKVRAHEAVQRALKTGRLVRAAECSGCGSEGTTHAHHDNYSKPLDVRWLCPNCHIEVHR